MSRRYAFVTAVDESLYFFYQGLLPILHERGIQAVGISSPGPLHEDLRAMGMTIIPIPIEREPAPARDLKSLTALRTAFRNGDFDAILLSTPKVGFVGSLAARTSGVQGRSLYMVRGRAYETMTGPKRSVLATMDRAACNLSGTVTAVSPSLGRSLIAEGICPPEKYVDFGPGSSRGVDLQRFSQRPELRSYRAQFRQEHGIADDAVVVGYTGHLRSDKGINELLLAMRRVLRRRDDVHLLLVGRTYPDRDPLDAELWDFALTHPRVHLTGFVTQPEWPMAAMDLFAFPTYREGFGNAALEAEALSLPLVASDIPGLRDAVEFGETALPVIPGDDQGLEGAIVRLIDDAELRSRLGSNGERRAHELFSQTVVMTRLADLLDTVAANGRQR